jgi:hypothetical protein
MTIQLGFATLTVVVAPIGGTVKTLVVVVTEGGPVAPVGPVGPVPPVEPMTPWGPWAPLGVTSLPTLTVEPGIAIFEPVTTGSL